MKNQNDKIVIEGFGIDHDIDKSYYVIKFINIHNNKVRIAIPLEEMALGGNAVFKILSQNNCKVPISTSERNSFIRDFQLQIDNLPNKKFLVQEKIGWTFHQEKYHYVLPHKCYPKNSSIILRLSEPTSKYRTSGTMSEWQDNVAAYAKGNSFMIFSLTVPFAAMLLHFFPELESTIFQLVAFSSKGKTTLLIASGSVSGGDSRGQYIESWLTTAHAIDHTAQAHCDNLLCLDEAGLAGSDKKMLLNAAYRLSSGKGKKRLVNSSGHIEWNVFALSSSEETMQQIAFSLGKPLMAG